MSWEDTLKKKEDKKGNSKVPDEKVRIKEMLERKDIPQSLRDFLNARLGEEE